MVKVKWQNDNNEFLYPLVWLRDNCQCPNCFHPKSKARLSLMRDLDVDIKVKDVNVQENQVISK